VRAEASFAGASHGSLTGVGWLHRPASVFDSPDETIVMAFSCRERAYIVDRRSAAPPR
jgi:hypothetical protein